MQNYTPEEVKDIQEREAKALAALKELQLTPAASVQKVNIGGDVFADKLIPFLKDIKFETVVSPIQQADLNNDGEETSGSSEKTA